MRNHFKSMHKSEISEFKNTKKVGKGKVHMRTPLHRPLKKIGQENVFGKFECRYTLDLIFLILEYSTNLCFVTL